MANVGENPNALNAQEASKRLHVSTKTIYKLAKDGDLASYRVGRKLFFTQDAIDAYVASSTGIASAVPVGAAKRHAKNGEGGAGGMSFSGDGTGGQLCAGPIGATGGLAGATFTIKNTGASFGAAKSVGVDAQNIEDDVQILRTLERYRGAGAFVIAGNDTVAGILAQRLCEQGLHAVNVPLSSYSGLVELYVGGVSAAAIHLYDQKTTSFNVPYVRRLVPGTPVKLVHLYRRPVGLCVRRGNPKGATSVVRAVRAGAVFANVGKPASARIFLDEQLIAAEVPAARVLGYDTRYKSEYLAAAAVAAGQADVSVANVEVARQFEALDFVPLANEQVDLALAKTDFSAPFIDAIEQALADKVFRAKAAAAIMGDAARIGVVLYDV